MTRVIHHRNYGVYVGDERGAPHHSPHAHVKVRGRRIASIHLLTLEPFIEIEQVPGELMDLIRTHQDQLLEEWERLNS